MARLLKLVWGAALLGCAAAAFGQTGEGPAEAPPPGEVAPAPARTAPAPAGSLTSTAPATTRTVAPPAGPNAAGPVVDKTPPTAAASQPAPSAGATDSAGPSAPAAVSAGSEPSELPPNSGTVPSTEEPPPTLLDIPDVGPGSINSPLISGKLGPEERFVAQPVPVTALSLIFGVTLLLAVGYLYYTARRDPSLKEEGAGSD